MAPAAPWLRSQHGNRPFPRGQVGNWVYHWESFPPPAGGQHEGAGVWMVARSQAAGNGAEVRNEGVKSLKEVAGDKGF